MTVRKTLTASVLAAGLALGMGATAVLALSAHGAEARSEKAGDHGKGQGAVRSAAKSGNASDKSQGHASGATEVASVTRGKSGTAGSNGRGPLARQLKNLNAMCANGFAWKHAADGSNIGKMRTYKAKFVAAQDLRGQASDTAASLESTYSGLDLNGLSASDVRDQIQSLEAERDSMLWTTDSQAYLDAVDAEATTLGRDLTDAEKAQILSDHNDSVHATYDPEIADLGQYADLLDQVASAEIAETNALNTATHDRGLTGDALTTFQDALVNGC